MAKRKYRLTITVEVDTMYVKHPLRTVRGFVKDAIKNYRGSFTPAFNGYPNVLKVKVDSISPVSSVESRYCVACERDTKAPLFDGCMNADCPKGFEPCL